MSRKLFLLPVAALALAAVARSADPAAPKTLMTAPGKLLLADDLSAGVGKDWKVAKGKWEASDRAARAAELKSDMHGAIARRNVAMTDAVIAFGFKMDGSKNASLSLNGAKGHVCRVQFRPTGIAVQKDDQDGKNGPDKGEVLDTKEVTVAPGEWHTLVVELRGPDILATLDGKHTAFGTHKAIDQPKTNLGFAVGGESVSFRDLGVWEAAPGKDWEATKAKLTAERTKK